ncbi:putative spindle assembly abnormal protein 6 [Blattamonas nauphoetae]|uniref:Spindle assembly abnormal protein 6 n=1 Tax=Blattamonas nauphoetae TaxID=2049346 RepID=A0ABQ9YEA2_9EUKA|nr:putative spindle assembly abnormal protein 6 [Blattamonas nauphoetae]
MELAEQDFTKFKERFRLNLSFEEFPTFFARDLESTKSDSLSISTSVADFNQLSAKSSASLTLNEHCTEATFILTQTQQYRNLELYRLDFKRPTDIHIIKYVVGQVAHWKTLALERQTKIDNQVQSLEEESSTLESLQRELAAIQSEHRIELSQANERTKLESADLVQKYETRYSEQIQAHQQEVSQLREKILSLETDKSSNLASINSNENRIRELTEQLESRTSELKTVRARFDTTEKEKNDLAARFSELQSTHSNLMLTCASLEQQINDRKERLVENETRIAQTNDFKQTLEGSIRELKEEITRLKKKLSAQAKEIEKGNGIIDNMWHEREELIRDVDELNDTITQHQNDLDSLQGAIHDKEDEIRELKRTLDDTNRSLTRTTQDYEKAEKDKKELAERVKVLTDVQERLAQQLTEKQLKERDEERKGFGMTSLGDTLLGKQRDDWQSRLGASSRFGDTNPRPMLEEADLLHSRVFGERTSRLRTDTQSQSPSIPVTHTRDTSHRALRSTSALRSGRTSTSPLPPPPVLPDLTALNKNLPIFPALSTSTLTERNTSNTQPKSDPLTRTKDPLSSDFRSHPLDKIVQPNTSPTGQFPSNKSPLSPTTQPPSTEHPTILTDNSSTISHTPTTTSNISSRHGNGIDDFSGDSKREYRNCHYTEDNIFRCKTTVCSQTLQNWDEAQPLTKFVIPETIYSIAATDDGSFIVAGTSSGTVYCWSFPTGQLCSKIHVHRQAITTISVANDCSYVVCGCVDGHIAVISAPLLFSLNTDSSETQTNFTQYPLQTLRFVAHTLSIQQIFFLTELGLKTSPLSTPQLILSVSDDETVKVHSLNGTLLLQASLATARPCCLAVSPSASPILRTSQPILFVGCSDGSIHSSTIDLHALLRSATASTLDLEKKTNIKAIRPTMQTFNTLSTPIHSLALVHSQFFNQFFLVSTSADGKCTVWNIPTQSALRSVSFLPPSHNQPSTPCFVAAANISFASSFVQTSSLFNLQQTAPQSLPTSAPQEQSSKTQKPKSQYSILPSSNITTYSTPSSSSNTQSTSSTPFQQKGKQNQQPTTLPLQRAMGTVPESLVYTVPVVTTNMFSHCEWKWEDEHEIEWVEGKEDLPLFTDDLSTQKNDQIIDTYHNIFSLLVSNL